VETSVQNMWRSIPVLALLAQLLTVPAHANDPTGEWRVEEGTAHVRTVICDGRLWGVIGWEQKPGVDAENPDPRLRGRPILGIPIVLGMKQVRPDKWEGPIYNARNGNTYQATITLKSPDSMEVEGCLWQGWLCGGQDWTRVKAPPSPPGLVGSAPKPDLCLRLGVGTGTGSGTGTGTGRSHERGLKQ